MKCLEEMTEKFLIKRDCHFVAVHMQMLGIEGVLLWVRINNLITQ